MLLMIDDLDMCKFNRMEQKHVLYESFLSLHG